MESRRSSENLAIDDGNRSSERYKCFWKLNGRKTVMYWMDIAASVAAQKHCNATGETASVDNISFESPVKLPK